MIISKNKIIAKYPLELGIENWYYNLVEISNCHWQINAMSLEGQILSYEDSDDTTLINRCKIDALAYNRKIKCI